MKSSLYKSFACVLLAFISWPVISFSQDTKTHVSSDKAFSITYPENWKVNKDRRFEFSVYQPGSGLMSPSMVNIEINKKAEGYENADIRQIADAELQTMKTSQSANIEIVDSKFQEQNGHEWWIIHGKLTALGKEYLTETYKTIHNGKVYVFSYSSNEKNYEKNKNVADKIIASVNFLTENNTVNNESNLTGNNNPRYYIEINADEIADFRDGFALARKGSNYFFYKPDGKLLQESDLYDYDMPKDSYHPENTGGFYNGITIIKDKRSGKYGYMDTTGKVIVPCFLSQALHFDEDGYAYANVFGNGFFNTHNYYFDKTGKRYQSLTNENAGLYFQEVFGNGNTKFVFRKNNTRAFETNLFLSKANDGYFKITDAVNRKTGFMDTTGKIKIPISIGGNVDDFSEGLALVAPNAPADYKYAFINKDGNVVIKINDNSNMQFRARPKPFRYGYSDCEIVSQTKHGSILLVDKNGNYINIQEIFEASNPAYMNSLANARDKDKAYYSIGYKGRNAFGIYVNCFFRLSPDAGILKQYAIKKPATVTGGIQSGKTSSQSDMDVNGIGMIDYTGKIIIPPVFSFIGEFDTVSGLAKAVRYTSDKEFIQGFINRKGEFVIIQKTHLNNF